MHIVIPDDYQDAVRGLACFAKLAGHSVTVYTDTVKEIDALAERFREADALVLIRERTRITQALLERLPRLKLISQTGKGAAHIDLAACARHGVTVTVGTGSPYAPAELTWALVLAALRHVPYEVARLRAGHWQSTMGTGLRGRTLGIRGPRRRAPAARPGQRGVHPPPRLRGGTATRATSARPSTRSRRRRGPAGRRDILGACAALEPSSYRSWS